MEQNDQAVYPESFQDREQAVEGENLEQQIDFMPMSALWWRQTPVVHNNQEMIDINNTNDDESDMIDEPDDQPIVGSAQEILESVSKQKSSSTKIPRDSGPRIKQPENWKVNVKKTARLKGEEYVGKGGKIVPAKLMRPPCDCRMLCSKKVSEEVRSQLHEVFWKTCNWEQRKQYIAMSVKESPKKRSRVPGKKREETRRQVTLTYSLMVKNECITVCKTMFLRTFSLSEKFVRHAMEKKRTSPGGIIGPDQRGRHTPTTKKSEAVKNRVREHINSFPSEKNNNSRDRSGRKYLDGNLNIATMHKMYVKKCQEDAIDPSDIVKESYYREMFKNEFNLGFKASPNDKSHKNSLKKVKRLQQPSSSN